MIENKSMCSLSIFDVSNLFSIIKRTSSKYATKN